MDFIFFFCIFFALLPTLRAYNAGTNWRNPVVFVSIENTTGTVQVWGLSSHGASLPVGSLSNITAIVSNAYAFAALKSDKSVIVWGDSIAGGDNAPLDKLVDIVEIHSTFSAFCAKTSSGDIIAWGDVANGGTTIVHGYDRNPQNAHEVFSTSSAFVTYNDTTLVQWGDNGDTDFFPSYLPTMGKIITIRSTGSAFAALIITQPNNIGTVIAWGGQDGCCPPNNAVFNVKQIYSTEGAFAALRYDGTVVAWGQPNWGGTQPNAAAGLLNITDIFSTKYAFLAISASIFPPVADLSEYKMVTWGLNFAGAPVGYLPGNAYPTHVVASEEAMALLMPAGYVVCWGKLGEGTCTVPSPLAQGSTTGCCIDTGTDADTCTGTCTVTAIFSSSQAMCALSNNFTTSGIVTCWGSPQHGGVAPVDQLNSVIITTIVSVDAAFAALTSDGVVIAWGNDANGGTVPVLPLPPLGISSQIIGSTLFRASSTNPNLLACEANSFGPNAQQCIPCPYNTYCPANSRSINQCIAAPLPTSQPSTTPSGQPSASPTSQPSDTPSSQPSSQPISHPTSQPTGQPTGQPTLSNIPSYIPTVIPTYYPSYLPTITLLPTTNSNYINSNKKDNNGIGSVGIGAIILCICVVVGGSAYIYKHEFGDKMARSAAAAAGTGTDTCEDSDFKPQRYSQHTIVSTSPVRSAYTDLSVITTEEHSRQNDTRHSINPILTMAKNPASTAAKEVVLKDTIPLQLTTRSADTARAGTSTGIGTTTGKGNI